MELIASVVHCRELFSGLVKGNKLGWISKFNTFMALIELPQYYTTNHDILANEMTVNPVKISNICHFKMVVGIL